MCIVCVVCVPFNILPPECKLVCNLLDVFRFVSKFFKVLFIYIYNNMLNMDVWPNSSFFTLAFVIVTFQNAVQSAFLSMISIKLPLEVHLPYQYTAPFALSPIHVGCLIKRRLCVLLHTPPIYTILYCCNKHARCVYVPSQGSDSVFCMHPMRHNCVSCGTRKQP